MQTDDRQPSRTSYTFALSTEQQAAVERELRDGNYTPATVPHARAAADRPGCRIVLYTSGKCVVQGKNAREWVEFVLEPRILGAVATGYDDLRDPDASRPHMGIDESGKGDFFGPLVIAAAYVDAPIVRELKRMNVRDSKTITSDRKALEMGRELRQLLRERHVLVPVGPRAYNRLYASIGSVNRLLAWGHARAIENLLAYVPECPRAIADQFGPERQIRQALLKAGRSIELVQRTKAESDPAVAAASVLARAAFLEALGRLRETYGGAFPKGASEAVRQDAAALVAKHGPAVLLDVAKCHFRTADQVLAAAGASRADLGPDGQAVSKAARTDAAPGFPRVGKPSGRPAKSREPS